MRVHELLQAGGDAQGYTNSLSDRHVLQMAHCLQIGEPEWMHVTYRAQVRGVVRDRVQDMMPLSLMSLSLIHI